MSYSTHSLSIKAWAEEDRPREKLSAFGPKGLSQAELLAIIIRSGSKKSSAVGVAMKLLSSYENNLELLSDASLSDLTKFDGIGEAKALSIISSLELGRRLQYSSRLNKPKIQSSYDAFELLAAGMQNLKQEVFKLLLLNRQNKLIKIHALSSGGLSSTIVDPKLVFKTAIDQLASGIILCHNHPSGNLKPSEADRMLTKKLKSAGTLLDIQVLDHLIISSEGYYSFADEGLL